MLVVNFLFTTWEPKHITIGLFEASDTSSVAMAVKLKQILNKFGLTQKILAYLKDEGSNLQTCVQALRVVVSCCDFDKVKSFDEYCFGHVLSNYVNMPLSITRWLVGYITLQSKLPKWTCRMYHMAKEIWQGDINVGKGVRGFWSYPHKLNTHVKTKYIKIMHPSVFFHILDLFYFLVFFPWPIHYMFKWIFSFMAIFFLD